MHNDFTSIQIKQPQHVMCSRSLNTPLWILAAGWCVLELSPDPPFHVLRFMDLQVSWLEQMDHTDLICYYAFKEYSGVILSL